MTDGAFLGDQERGRLLEGGGSHWQWVYGKLWHEISLTMTNLRMYVSYGAGWGVGNVAESTSAVAEFERYVT